MKEAIIKDFKNNKFQLFKGTVFENNLDELTNVIDNIFFNSERHSVALLIRNESMPEECNKAIWELYNELKSLNN
jgi:hypothetical protein